MDYRTIAQIDVATGLVMAVVNMADPQPSQDPEVLFMEVPNDSVSGKYWNGKTFQDDPLTP